MAVYKTNKATIRAWLNAGPREEGRNPRGSLFFEGSVLYSYGYHFPLAIKHHNLFALNSDPYSVTTSKHQAMVRREIPTRAILHTYPTEIMKNIA